MAADKRMYCGDFLDHKDGFMPAECCESCHEDAELGYVELMDYTHDELTAVPEGRTAFLCCRVVEKIKEQG